MKQGLWKMGSVPGEVSLAFGRVGEGPEPLLALHGLTNQHRVFGGVARNLSHADGLVALDLRGRGDSAKPPPGNYGLDAHAGDVIHTLDFLGVEAAVIVGHSMGSYIALHTALRYPDRVKAFVLLDSGQPRPERLLGQAVNEEVLKGLERARRRLDMVFETPEDYLDFWYPDQNLTFEDLSPDLADYYRYDLEEVDGGYKPKASRAAVNEDMASVSSKSPTAAEMGGVGCPVALVRATEGASSGTDPLVPDEARDTIAEVLDLRSERLLSGANHYSMMFGGYAQQTASVIDDFLRELG
jgi:lipase